MYPILFSIGKVNVYTHGLMIALGGLSGGLMIYLLAKKDKMWNKYIFDILIYSFLGGLIGARILYVLIYFKQFNSFGQVINIWNGGLISFGGILGGYLVAGIFLKIRKEKILAWFDIGFIGLMFGWAIGRVGCFLSGDSLGIKSQAVSSVWGRLPVQLFESFWALLIAFNAYFLFKKYKFKSGFIFSSGMAIYAIGRIGLDFLREEEKLLGFLRIGQVGGLIIFILAISFLIFLTRSLNLERS